jgi:hypothetical protein
MPRRVNDIHVFCNIGMVKLRIVARQVAEAID